MDHYEPLSVYINVHTHISDQDWLGMENGKYTRRVEEDKWVAEASDMRKMF